MSTERGPPIGVGWVIQGWGGSCRGGVDHTGVGVGHAGVEWVIQGWGGSQRGGWVMQGWGGLYRCYKLVIQNIFYKYYFVSFNFIS